MRKIFEGALLWYLRRAPLQRGKQALSRRVDTRKLGPEVVYQSVDGAVFSLDLRDFVMRQIFLLDRFELNTQRHLRRLLAPGMTFVDIGANIGAYTVPMAKLVHPGRVVAFEPNPAARSRLERNLALSDALNVKVEPLGLSAATGTGSLATESFIGDRSWNLGSASLHSTEESDSVDVELVSLDDYCSANGLHKVDAIKLDVEGHELSVLQGAANTLGAAEKMVLVVEVDDNCVRGGHTKDDLVAAAIEFGFVPYEPASWPFGLRRVAGVGADYNDNVIFLKGYPNSGGRGQKFLRRRRLA